MTSRSQVFRPDADEAGVSAGPRALEHVGGAALAIVGIGIQWEGQTTLAARRAIERADVVLCAVADGHAAAWLCALNERAESFVYPRDGRARREIYRAMVDRIVVSLQEGNRVCAVFYGSPSLLTWPAHEALRVARRQGFPACMLPAVSFLDCLLTDLHIDPGEQGCSLYEAGEFLRTRRVVDPYGHLILAQVAAIGEHGTLDECQHARVVGSLGLLVRRLTAIYPPSHPTILYEAAAHPLASFRADVVPLAALPEVRVGERSTLYLPPLGEPPVDEDMRLALEQLRTATKSRGTGP
jgi:hypothetical protein